jgi:hypothetical protein
MLKRPDRFVVTWEAESEYATGNESELGETTLCPMTLEQARKFANVPKIWGRIVCELVPVKPKRKRKEAK